MICPSLVCSLPIFRECVALAGRPFIVCIFLDQHVPCQRVGFSPTGSQSASAAARFRSCLPPLSNCPCPIHPSAAARQQLGSSLADPNGRQAAVSLGEEPPGSPAMAPEVASKADHLTTPTPLRQPRQFARENSCPSPLAEHAACNDKYVIVYDFAGIGTAALPWSVASKTH